MLLSNSRTFKHFWCSGQTRLNQTAKTDLVCHWQNELLVLKHRCTSMQMKF